MYVNKTPPRGHKLPIIRRRNWILQIFGAQNLSVIYRRAHLIWREQFTQTCIMFDYGGGWRGWNIHIKFCYLLVVQDYIRPPDPMERNPYYFNAGEIRRIPLEMMINPDLRYPAVGC